MTKLLLACDGGSRGNPGPSAYGFVVYQVKEDAGLTATVESPDSSGAVKVLEKCGNYLGITTNNQAEYEGLIAGLKWVLEHEEGCELEIRMDSLLIVNQIKGLYKVKSAELFPRWQVARGLLNKLSKWTISHTYRSGNSLADSLVNQALDSHK